MSMIGQTVSHYKILEKLGEGGMGVVYKAEDTKLRRAVALKFLTPEMTRDKEAKGRFIQEAQAASALDHPNIAVVHEIDDTDDGRSFICMAYYEGKTLKDQIESGLFDINRAIRIAIQIADGLQRAHEAGIVHRDIKPANIILTGRNEVKIVDFGVAKLSSQTRGSTSTTGGTAAYMSPEQAQGIDVDARSDLFSLGVVVYEMLTGKRPFIAEHEAALMYSIVNVDPAPPSSIRRNIPKELDAIILRLLDKNPSRRPQSAAQLRADLKRLVGLTESTRQFVVPPNVVVDKKWFVLVTVLILFGVLFLVPTTRDVAERWLGFGGIPSEKHLAVLPFMNIGGDSINQAFCDGLMEILSSKLTTLHLTEEVFSVIPSVEVRNRRVTTPDQARQVLHATLAITGSIQREKNQVRIILNLVDTKTLRQIDSKILDDQMATLAQLQDKTVIDLIGMLKVKPEGRVLRAALAGSTTDSRAYDFYVQGRGYLQNYQKVANIDFAISLFQRALKEDSTYAVAYAALGEAHWRKYDGTKNVAWIEPAIMNCRRALELDDKLPSAHITLGLIEQGSGRYESAAREFQLALEIDSLNADAYREAARTLESLRELANSELTFQKAIALRPSYWAGYSDLGAFYFRRKRYEEAAEQFRRVLEFAPDNSRGFSGLGASYSALERLTEAEDMFKRAIAADTNNYAAYSNLATLYFRQNRYAESAPMYEKSLALTSRDHRVWGNLASAYFWSGQRDKAIERFQRASYIAEEQRKVNPRDATVLSFLADYYSILGKKSIAIDLTKQALRLAPDAVEIIKRSADAYEQLGLREQALKQVEVALTKGLPIQELERSPALKELRSDNRYRSLIQKLGKKP